MNNALLQSDEIPEAVDRRPLLRARLTELKKIIDAINALAEIPEWQTVKALVFDGQAERIEQRLLVEAKKLEPSLPAIYRLQGEQSWARRYSDLYKLAETYKAEFNSITQKLKEVSEI